MSRRMKRSKDRKIFGKMATRRKGANFPLAMARGGRRL